MAKVFLENIVPTWRTPLKLKVIGETFCPSGASTSLCVSPLRLPPLILGLVRCTHGIIKTQLENCVETQQIRWPKH